MGLLSLCWHHEMGPIDADGKAICAKCGAVLQMRLTAQAMDEAREAVLRQGVHLRSCVDTPEGWCCAPGCPSARR